MTLTLLTRLLVFALNCYFWVTRKTVRAAVLQQDRSLVDEVVQLEKAAYTEAGIMKSIEGRRYFSSLLLGLEMVDFVHLGIRDEKGALLAYMSVLMPKLEQWKQRVPGEFVFPVCFSGWNNNGSPKDQVFIYRKVLRHPDAAKLLYKTGAWRMLLGFATMLISLWQRTGWLMVTQAQPDTMRFLKKHLNTAFPGIEWLVEQSRGKVTILLIRYPEFTFRDLFLMISRVSLFAKLNKKRRKKN